MLVEAGLLSEDDVAQAAADAREAGVRLGEYIVDKGLVTAEALALTLSTQLGLRFLDLMRTRIQPEATPTRPGRRLPRQHADPDRD